MYFYAGSGTTAQAVYEINQEDRKKLSCVLIQREEAVSQKSKSHETCCKLGIQPLVSALMLRRINTWLLKTGVNQIHGVTTEKKTLHRMMGITAHFRQAFGAGAL